MKLRTTVALAALTALSVPGVTFAAEASNSYPDYQRCQNHKTGATVAGALIGGLAGAVLGSQVSGHGARTEGSVIGAGLGLLVGSAVGDERVNCGPSPAEQARRAEYDSGYGTAGYPVDHSYDNVPGAPTVPPRDPPPAYDRSAWRDEGYGGGGPVAGDNDERDPGNRGYGDEDRSYRDDDRGYGADQGDRADDRGYRDDQGASYRDQGSYRDQRSYQEARSYEEQRSDEEREGDIDENADGGQRNYADDGDDADQAQGDADADADGRWRDHARQDQRDWQGDWRDERSNRGDRYRYDPNNRDDDDEDEDDGPAPWRRPIG